MAVVARVVSVAAVVVHDRAVAKNVSNRVGLKFELVIRVTICQ